MVVWERVTPDGSKQPVAGLSLLILEEFNNGIIKMKCRKCNKLLFDGDTNCPDCGEPMQNRHNHILWDTLLVIIFSVVLVLLIKHF